MCLGFQTTLSGEVGSERERPLILMEDKKMEKEVVYISPIVAAFIE